MAKRLKRTRKPLTPAQKERLRAIREQHGLGEYAPPGTRVGGRRKKEGLPEKEGSIRWDYAISR